MNSQTLTHADENNGSETCNLVTFVLAEQTYALPIAPIVQIVEMVAITALPQADSTIKGVVNYHGRTVPVLDLRRTLGLPPRDSDPDTHMIILTAAERMLALAVDRVLQVADLPQQQVAHAQDVMPAGFEKVPLLQGIAHTAEGTVIVLDPEQLLASSTVGALSQMAAVMPAQRVTADSAEGAL
jgi:purine-binding chemotaxis protein CheW